MANLFLSWTSNSFCKWKLGVRFTYLLWLLKSLDFDFNKKSLSCFGECKIVTNFQSKTKKKLATHHPSRFGRPLNLQFGRDMKKGTPGQPLNVNFWPYNFAQFLIFVYIMGKSGKLIDIPTPFFWVLLKYFSSHQAQFT